MKRKPNKVLAQSHHPEGEAQIKRLSRKSYHYLKKLNETGAELSLTLTTDRAIQSLNKTWRRKDRPTDVLSFPAGAHPPGAPGPVPLGDVVISLDTAKRQAKSYGRTLDEELNRYLAHGLLHLLGYDHERSPAEARQMARRENELLGLPGMLADAGPDA